MSILSILLTLAVFGFLAWLLLQIPMPELVKKIIIGVLCLLIVLYILNLFGVATPIHLKLIS